jgi:peptidoglycan/LPS O-acetylase OafA/YrhL
MGCLRTILALSVVLAHGARWCDPRLLVGGPAAVQLFYLISGFVISHVLLEVPAYQDATASSRPTTRSSD